MVQGGGRIGKGWVSEGTVPNQVVKSRGDGGLDSRLRGNDWLSGREATGVWIPAFAGMTGCLEENHLNWNAIVRR